jgi:hypothetical protein
MSERHARIRANFAETPPLQVSVALLVRKLQDSAPAEVDTPQCRLSIEIPDQTGLHRRL